MSKKPKSFDKIDWSDNESWMRWFEVPIPIPISEAHPKLLEKIAKAVDKIKKLDVHHRPGCKGYMDPEALIAPPWTKLSGKQQKEFQKKHNLPYLLHYAHQCTCGAESRQKQITAILAILDLDDEYELSQAWWPKHEEEEILVICELCETNHPISGTIPI